MYTMYANVSTKYPFLHSRLFVHGMKSLPPGTFAKVMNCVPSSLNIFFKMPNHNGCSIATSLYMYGHWMFYILGYVC